MREKHAADGLGHYLDSVRKAEGAFPAAVSGLTLLRFRETVQPIHLFYRPRLCIPFKGIKRTTIGEQIADYSPDQALVVAHYGSGTSMISPLSGEGPFLGFTSDLDLLELWRLSEEIHDSESVTNAGAQKALVIDLTPELRDCAERIVNALGSDETLRILYPGILREMSYWLLKSPAGGLLRSFLSSRCPTPQIGRALKVLDARYRDTLNIGELADEAGMSQSVFHQRFKMATAMSPIQYQKELRLLHARRVLVEATANVDEAARIVGYKSTSQFSRDYRRRFGKSPRRDAEEVSDPR